MPKPPLIKGLQSVWMTVTNVASVGSSLTMVDVLLKCGSAGSRPFDRETKRETFAERCCNRRLQSFLNHCLVGFFYNSLQARLVPVVKIKQLPK